MTEIESIKLQIIKLAQAIESVSLNTKSYYYIVDEIKQMQQQVKVEPEVEPEVAEDKFKFAISVLNEIEGQMHKMENIEAKTFNRIMNFIAIRRNFLHKKQ